MVNDDRSPGNDRTAPKLIANQSVESMNQSVGTPPWTGEVDLTFGLVNGRTKPIVTYTKAPFKIQRSFYQPESGVCQVVLLHTGGGIVGGDRLLSRLDLQPQTQVLLTTPAAQKIYRSDGLLSQQNIKLHIQKNSILEFLPLETIVFNGAKYEQKTIVTLETGACFVGWEITRFGRTARAESFETGSWRSFLEVWQAQERDSEEPHTRPIWIDRQQLIDPHVLEHHPFGLNRQAVIGNLVLLGRSLSTDGQATLVQSWEREGYTAPSFTLTRTMEGLVGRYRGNSSHQARQGFIHLWQDWKRSILGQDPWIPRLWG